MSYKSEKLHKFIGRTDCPIIVDVRSRQEFKQTHIPGAIHLPFWLMPFRYKSLKNNMCKQIVLYCEHGPRAVFARQILQSKGFGKADCLDGHMQAWRKAGFPLDSK